MNVIDKTLSKIYNPEMYYLTIHKNKIRKQGGMTFFFSLMMDGIQSKSIFPFCTI